MAHAGSLGRPGGGKAGHASIVFVEDTADGRIIEDPAKVTQVWLTFRAMQTEAQNVRASRDLIARMAEELGTGPTGARALTAAPTAERA